MNIHAILPAAALVVMPVRAAEAPAEGLRTAGGSGQHVFWRIEKPRGGAMYLLGSLHFGSDRLYPLPACVLDAFANATTVVFETDLGAAVGSGFSQRMDEAASCRQGEFLGDLVEDDLLRLFGAAVESLHLRPEPFERYRPWYCANSLMTAALRHAGVDPARGIDRVLFSRALQEGKQITTLETPEFQLELFAGLGNRDAALLLRHAVAEVDEVHAFVDTMLTAYSGGDLDTLRALINDGFDALPALRQRFFSDRNAAWLPVLKAHLSRPGTDLVVVGAGHLLGEDGLVALLGAAGYAATRL
ncbi:MAG: TraB/GumN family protein [Lentisphaeria bacterium]|nr:TraB/GumN family protein [Lentisphaeria bacterium]